MVLFSTTPRLTNPARHNDSYFVCATPRTGSSLLCGLLESTGVAGRPESYFRLPDEQSWAVRWGINPSPDGAFNYAAYVRAAIAAGRTENGVFAARVMWGTLDQVIEKLAVVHPHLGRDDAALLSRAFGHTRFVYLRREDVLAQAVSWLRAEQTNVWSETPQDPTPKAKQEPCFDLAGIQDFIRLIGDHNAAWQKWFASVGVRPHTVRYEDLAADPVSVTRGVLDFLGMEPSPTRHIVAHHRRLADEVNAQWIERYRSETAKL